MNKLIINDTFSSVYPDGFHIMNSDELKKFFVSDRNRCGLHDDERHMVLSVSWNKPKLLGFLTDERSVLRGAETRLKLNLQEYRHVDTLNRTIATCPAIGIRFEYKVTGTNIYQYGDLYVFKYEKAYYGVQLVGRKNDFKESQREMEFFLQSITILR